MNAPARLSPFAANALFFLSAAGLFLIALVGQPLYALFGALLPGAGPEVLQLCVYAMYYLPFLLVPASIMLRRADAWESARLKPVRVGQMAAVCAVAVLGTLLSLQLGALWAVFLDGVGFPVAGEGIAIPSTTSGLAATVFSLGVLPGVCEELVFRGAILGSYERNGTRRAIFVSSLLFALVHGSVEGLPTQLMLGAIMGYLVFACDSIYAAMAYHTVHNASLLVIAMLVERGGALDGQPEVGAGASLFEQSGGIAAVIGSAVTAAILLAILLSVLRAFDRRRRANGIEALPPGKARMSRGARVMLVLALVIVAGLYALTIIGAVILRGGA